MTIINQLHPYDYFDIQCPQEISLEEQKSLQLCYQPIIGLEAVSLYLKLWIETQNKNDNLIPHHYLLDTLNINLNQLFQARITLEAIGLLETWEKVSDERKIFHYILRRPFSPVEFFNDTILSVALMRKIGIKFYEKLKGSLVPRKYSLTGYSNITRQFSDVFVAVTEDEINKINSIVYLRDGTGIQKPTYPFEYDLFDFKLFFQGINQHMIPQKLFTLDIKLTVAKLAFIYNFTAMDMQKIVIMAWNGEDVLSKETLEICAADFYKLVNGQDNLKLKKRYEIFEENVIEVEKISPKNSKEEIIHFLDTTSPIMAFKHFNEYLPSEALVMCFNDFLRRGISYGVINTLIQYIALSDDLTYNPNFMQVVMDNWVKKGAKTARDTIQIATREHEYREAKSKNRGMAKIKKDSLQFPVSSERNSDLIDYESSTPYQYLKMLNRGNEPFKGHVKTAESLHLTYNFPVGMVNVIIKFVWDKTEGNLPETFVEAIASELRYKNIDSVEKAVRYLSTRGKGFVPKITEISSQDSNGELLSYDEKTPYNFLRELFNGEEPVQFIVELAENLVINQKMPIGVVNVLMEFAYNKSDGKITKNFVQAIASNWMSENLKGAEDALRLIKLQEEKADNKINSAITLDIPLAFKVTLKDLENWLPEYDEVIPLEFMKKLLNGKNPLPYLMNIVDELVINHNVRVGVVNAILEYVIKSNQGRVGKNTLHSLALNIQLQKIELAKFAIEYIQNYYIKEKIQTNILSENLRDLYPDGYVFNEEHKLYEQSTPYEFIKFLNDGVEPFPYTVKAAENLILKRKMNPAVVNYLLEYVIENTKGALPEKYINSVADSWIRNRVTTIEEAKRVISIRKKQNQKKVSVVPEWFKQEKEQQKQSQNEKLSENDSQESSINFEEKRKNLLRRIKKIEEGE